MEWFKKTMTHPSADRPDAHKEAEPPGLSLSLKQEKWLIWAIENPEKTTDDLQKTQTQAERHFRDLSKAVIFLMVDRFLREPSRNLDKGFINGLFAIIFRINPSDYQTLPLIQLGKPSLEEFLKNPRDELLSRITHRPAINNLTKHKERRKK